MATIPPALRGLMKFAIAFFFTLAVFFFLCIFLLGLAQRHNMVNQVDELVPIQQAEYANWGQIPGNFSFAFTRNYKLYEFNYEPTAGASEINLSTVGEYNYDLTRDYEDPTWYPQKSVVQFKQKYNYPDPTNENGEVSNADDSMMTINLGGYSVWYQMVNKPFYYKAW